MIFNLFKSKPTLKELIPEGFVDIHSHILPGIDDGAKNVEESLMMVDLMNKMGFSKIIGTPHTYAGVHNNENNDIKKSYDSLIKVTKDKYRINYASEYMLDSSILERANKKELLCLKEKYVLVEMSYLAPPINLYEIIFELRANEYIPILAHPERYIYLHNNFEEYFKLKKAGCLFQANLLSTTMYYGGKINKVLDNLISRNLIDFVGSDIHNKSHIVRFDTKIKISKIDKLEKIIKKNSFFEK